MRRRFAGIQSLRRVSAPLALVLAMASCRGLPLSLKEPLPGERLMPSQQLEFHTDFDLKPNDPLVRELSAERDYIATTLSMPPSDEKIHVYLYHDAATYGEVLAKKFPMVPNRRAFFVESDTRLEVYAHASDRVAEDLRHEVAHGYLHSCVPAIPLWLDEGLATYSEVLFYEAIYPELVPWWWSYRVERFAPQGDVGTSIYAFDAFQPYVNATYLRTAVFLQRLRAQMGDAAFFSGLARYAQGRGGRIAAPADFWTALDPTGRSDVARLRAEFGVGGHR